MVKALLFIPLLAAGGAFADAGQLVPADAPFPSPPPPWPILQQRSTPVAPPAPAPPRVAYVTLRGTVHGCPSTGSRWTEQLVVTSAVVVLDCPVGVSYKTWSPGRRVHVGIPNTVELHPGDLSGGAAIEYSLVAPKAR